MEVLEGRSNHSLRFQIDTVLIWCWHLRRFISVFTRRVTDRIPALISQAPPRIILHMARPDAVRRVKTYSAADGFVYQYYFFEGNRAQRGESPGGEFTYVVSIDRQTAFPFKIFVHQSAHEACGA